MSLIYGNKQPVIVMYDSSDVEVIRYSLPKFNFGMWCWYPALPGSLYDFPDGWSQVGTDMTSHTTIDLNPQVRIGVDGKPKLSRGYTGTDFETGFIGEKMSGKITIILDGQDTTVNSKILDFFSVKFLSHTELSPPQTISYMKLMPHYENADLFKANIINPYKEINQGSYLKYKVVMDFRQIDLTVISTDNVYVVPMENVAFT